jgi:hypothetical protein
VYLELKGYRKEKRKDGKSFNLILIWNISDHKVLCHLFFHVDERAYYKSNKYILEASSFP